MLKNIYSPLSGGTAIERKIEIISNNLANTNTTGFKEEMLALESQQANPWPSYRNPLPPAHFKMDMREVFPLRGDEIDYTVIGDVKTDFSQGSLRDTGSRLDVAIEGDGFFSVMTPFGERFSRDGSFILNSEGMLMTRSGGVVQGEKGAIVGLSEGNLKILPSGEVYEGDRFVDRIRVTSFQDTSLLQKLGENLFVHDGPPTNAQTSPARLAQGHLEASNVNPVKNLTNLIVAHRTYEALQKAVKSHDQTMELANNKLAQVE